MELITGLGSATHITALQDAFWHRGIWSSNCILKVGNNLNPSIISNNEIQIQSGIGSVQGRFFIVEPNTYDSVTINNGTVGENRIDLIVAQYQKNEETQVESMTWEVIQGTPSADTPVAPSYTQGNIDNGDVLVQFPVFQVNIEGINIVGVDNLLDTVPAFTDKNAELLFEGAIPPNENAIITLSESMKSYKILVFLIHQNSTGIPFGYGFYPIIDQTQVPGFAGQSVLCVDGVPYETNNVNTISIYAGRFENISNTQIKTIVPIHNILLRQGQPIGGASEYYVRQIWGIR